MQKRIWYLEVQERHMEEASENIEKKVVNEAKDMLKEGDIYFGKIFIFELEDEFHIDVINKNGDIDLGKIFIFELEDEFHMDIIDKNGDIKIGKIFICEYCKKAFGF